MAIEDGNVVDVLTHPNTDRYPNQRVYPVAHLEEGMLYQTLVTMVLHKYVTGRLVDSKN